MTPLFSSITGEAEMAADFATTGNPIPSSNPDSVLRCRKWQASRGRGTVELGPHGFRPSSSTVIANSPAVDCLLCCDPKVQLAGWLARA